VVNAVTGAMAPLGGGLPAAWGDGHPSVSPDGRYLVTDTYPDRRRQQSLLLFDLQTQELEVLGRFLLPVNFYAETRVDLHPRWSPDGSLISIDSGHRGHRGTYILDIGGLLAHRERIDTPASSA
jgi:Tol biopolymer transport system component